MKHIKHGQAIGILANVGMIAGIVTLSHAQDTRPVDLSGIWSTNSLDTLEHPAWDIEGQFSCRCATETYQHLQ